MADGCVINPHQADPIRIIALRALRIAAVVFLAQGLVVVAFPALVLVAAAVQVVEITGDEEIKLYPNFQA